MKFPEWLKPALYGAVAGAVAISIAGFSWGGWVTGSSAREMAADQASLEVVAALVPVCVEQSRLGSERHSHSRESEGRDQLQARRDAHEDRMGYHAGLDRSRSQRGESLHGQAGRAVLTRPTPAGSLPHVLRAADARRRHFRNGCCVTCAGTLPVLQTWRGRCGCAACFPWPGPSMAWRKSLEQSAAPSSAGGPRALETTG